MILTFGIVAYNACRYLPSLLSDLKKQDYPHSLIQVILVDSMSTDNTKSIMLHFADEEKDFKQIIVLDNPNRILAAGWNVLLKHVAGDAILRIDAHASIPKDFIKKNVQYLQKGYDICGGKVLSLQIEQGMWQQTLLAAENSMFGGSFAAFRRSDKVREVSTLAFAIYRKKVFESVGFYNEKLVRTEDNEMHYRMRTAGYKFYFNPNIISYRFSRNSLYRLIKQKFLNGYWIGLTMGICPACFSLFHFVPFLFIISIIFCTILYLCGFKVFFIVLILSYLIVAILMALATYLRNRITCRFAVLLPLIFLLLHISYGIGTLVGLIKMPFWICYSSQEGE